MGAHARHDVLGDGPVIKGVGALFGERLQHAGHRPVLEEIADGPRRAALVVVERAGARIGAQRDLLRQQAVEARRDREAVLRQMDRRLEQLRPGQFAETLVRLAEQARRARHADRTPAHHGGHEGHGLAADHEAVGRRGGGRGLAAVERRHRLRRLVVNHHEGAAAQPRALRLDLRQHELNGDRRVDRRTALTQHRAPRLCGEGIGGRGHIGRGDAGLFQRAAGGGLGRLGLSRRGRLRLRQRGGGEQRGEGEAAGEAHGRLLQERVARE